MKNGRKFIKRVRKNDCPFLNDSGTVDFGVGLRIVIIYLADIYK